MKMGFYSKIAFSNLKKNRRFYFPHILTGTGLMASFYIILTLAMDGRLAQIRGGSYISTFMGMGVIIMVLLSSILLLYTNSFLMKQRKREFGLYSVLGMEKRHVCRVLFFESFLSNGAAVLLGLIAGIGFYKICSLLVCRLLKAELVMGFYYITPKTILPAVILFLGIYILAFLINVLNIYRMKPVELLKSRQMGEKEPRVHWILLIIGLASLGYGYYIALTTANPLDAIYAFFIAVLLVILGTYCLFVAGSIFVLKALKKNERYYYQKNHMTAVSGLLYRMKQNAVGLASITILATAVLVMLSTTLGLYSGVEKTLASKYPQQLYISANYEQNGENVPVTSEEMETILREAAAKEGIEVSDLFEQKYLETAFLLDHGLLSGDQSQADVSTLAKLYDFIMMSEEEYRIMTGETLNLAEGEIALCPFTSDAQILEDEIYLDEESEKVFHVRERLTYFPVKASDLGTIVKTCGMVLNQKDIEWFYQTQKRLYGSNASEYDAELAVTFSDSRKLLEVGFDLEEDIREGVRALADSREGTNGAMGMSIDALWDTRDYVYGMYGSLLFLGILLGLVFLCATALIIYYKQISEGYEDRERFQIMEKIGMSSREVRRSIYSQMILVFALPLIVAGIHTIFASPILIKILKVLLLPNTAIYIACAIGVYLVFALIYIGIYVATAGTYYRIVH